VFQWVCWKQSQHLYSILPIQKPQEKREYSAIRSKLYGRTVFLTYAVCLFSAEGCSPS